MNDEEIGRRKALAEVLAFLNAQEIDPYELYWVICDFVDKFAEWLPPDAVKAQNAIREAYKKKCRGE